MFEFDFGVVKDYSVFDTHALTHYTTQADTLIKSKMISLSIEFLEKLKKNKFLVSHYFKLIWIFFWSICTENYFFFLKVRTYIYLFNFFDLVEIESDVTRIDNQLALKSENFLTSKN